ncbi:MAG: TraR/DksA C4-type zinc finger protein [Candidatus Pacebacteria bacterium]|nr:TraR/DksA C4-type zinc finger protein [Candidatus Paceibacterota bacterium]
MLTKEYIQEKKRWLEARLKGKAEILKSDGQTSWVHSEDDLIAHRAALARIEDGSYGLCMHCGGPVEEYRLKIIPETPFCFSCAQTLQN